MTLKWRHGDRELSVVYRSDASDRGGIPEQIEIGQEEMYGEYFDIPKPDDVVFAGWFSGGEVFQKRLYVYKRLRKDLLFSAGT